MSYTKTHPYNPYPASAITTQESPYAAEEQDLVVNAEPSSNGPVSTSTMIPRATDVTKYNSDYKESSESLADGPASTLTMIPEATDVTPYDSDYKKSHTPQVVVHEQKRQYDHGEPVVESHHYIPMNTRKPVVLSQCPHCSQKHVATTTRSKATSPTWLCVVAGAVIFWPLCWVPLVAKPLKQTNHYCQGCGNKVGRVKPFQ